MTNGQDEKQDIICWNERIATVKTSIYDVFFSANDLTKVSFPLILNRILILIQKKLTFVIYKKEKSGYKRHYSFVVDGPHKARFEKELAKIEDTNNCIINKDDLFDTYLYKDNEEESKYKLAVFRIHRENIDGNGYQSRFYFLKKNEDTNEPDNKKAEYSYVRHMIKGIFEGQYSKAFVDAANQAIDSVSDLSSMIEEGRAKELNRVEYLKTLDETMKASFRTEIDKKIDKAFLKVYESTKIINSLCLKDNHNAKKSELSNILFFVRDYSNLDYKIDKKGNEVCFLKKRREEKNHQFDGYDYNIRICIPLSQRAEIKKYLSDLRYKKHKVVSFVPNKMMQNYEAEYQAIMKILDDWFWEEAGKEEFEDAMIDIIESPIGQHARSIVDPVFQSGLVHFHRPFQMGGLDRAGIDREDLKSIQYLQDIPTEKLNDCKRIVIAHYLFAGMVHSKNTAPENLNVVMIPVELNGRVFAVTTHLMISDKANIFSTNDVWYSTYLLYSGIGARIERNLRRHIKLSVVSTVIDSFYKKFEEQLERDFKLYGTQKTFDVEFILNEGNRLAFLMSLFMPYDYLKFSLSFDKNGSSDDDGRLRFFYDQVTLNYSQMNTNYFFSWCRKNENILGKIDYKDFSSLLRIREKIDKDIEMKLNVRWMFERAGVDLQNFID